MSQIGFDFSARTQSSIVFAVVVAVIVVVVVAGVALVVVLSTIAIVKLQGQFGYFYSFFCQNKKSFLRSRHKLTPATFLVGGTI